MDPEGKYSPNEPIKKNGGAFDFSGDWFADFNSVSLSVLFVPDFFEFDLGRGPDS